MPSTKEYLVNIAAQMQGVQEMLASLQKLTGQMSTLQKDSKKNSSHFKDFGRSVKGAANQMASFAKVFAKQLIGFVSMAALAMKAARSIKQLVKDTVNLNDNLSKSAKELGKTEEQARLHNVALAAMGKTMDEINKDEKLKKTYDDLIKLGDGFKFKRAKEGLTTIEDLNTELTKLKFTLRLGLSQVYEYFKAYAAEPLKQLKKWLGDILPTTENGLDSISAKIGKGLAKALKGIMFFGREAFKTAKGIIDFIKQIIGWFRDLTPESKAAAIGVAAAIGIITGALSPIVLIFGILFLLVNDFVNWSAGKASFFGDAWYTVIEKLASVYVWISAGAKMIYDAFVIVYNMIALLSQGMEWLGLSSGSLSTISLDKLKDPMAYEDDPIYKSLMGVLEGRDKAKQSGTSTSTSNGDNGTNAAGTNNVEDMDARDILRDYLVGNFNHYPDYAGQNGGGGGDLYSESHTNVNVNANYNINETNPSGAAAAANNFLGNMLEHTMASALQ